MSNVTELLAAIQQGQPQAAEDLLPLVYDELRRLARQKLAHEKPGHTLQATALVHEAYLRLMGPGVADQESEVAKQGAARDSDFPSATPDPRLPTPGVWDGRGHFFAAAAESMRRILVESARRKGRLKRGGGLVRGPSDLEIAAPEHPDQVL